jgi:transcription antitermination factor NusA-like protein
LKPARINGVTIEDGKAYVDINDDQKWLAIGREAVNIRLAGQLTGFMIELK